MYVHLQFLTFWWSMLCSHTLASITIRYVSPCISLSVGHIVNKFTLSKVECFSDVADDWQGYKITRCALPRIKMRNLEVIVIG